MCADDQGQHREKKRRGKEQCKGGKDGTGRKEKQDGAERKKRVDWVRGRRKIGD